MKLLDIVLLVLVAAAVVLAVRGLRRRKDGCSCGCGGCAAADACDRKKEP